MSRKEGGHNMKKTFVILAVGIFLAMAVSSVYAYEYMHGPTELTYWDQAKTHNGYTLFAPSGGETTYLIDMAGNVVHTWPKFGSWAELLPNGNILSTGITETDWDGNLVWEYRGENIANLERVHHDKVRIFNQQLGIETTLIIAEIKVFYDEAVANGSDPDNNISEDVPATVDEILEIDRDGNIVWRWFQWDHIIQNYDATKLNFGDPAAPENWGRLDVNVNYNTSQGLSDDWNHFNGMDYNPTLDQIVLSSRHHSEFVIIDHSLSTEEAATRAGDYLYRWGNPWNYGQGDQPTYNPVVNGHQQLYGQHDIQWIDEGLPGAGNFLVFSNGNFGPFGTAHSTIFEINPYDGPMADGVYIQQHDAGYTDTGSNADGLQSNQVVWKFNSVMYHRFAKGFFSNHGSQCNRLSNGNTYVISQEQGHMFEVTYGDPENNVLPEVVWEYTVPILNDDSIVKVVQVGQRNETRARRIEPDHPGLAGKDLSVMGPITEMSVEGAMDKFRESKTGFSGAVIIVPGGDADDPYDN